MQETTTMATLCIVLKTSVHTNKPFAFSVSRAPWWVCQKGFSSNVWHMSQIVRNKYIFPCSIYLSHFTCAEVSSSATYCPGKPVSGCRDMWQKEGRVDRMFLKSGKNSLFRKKNLCECRQYHSLYFPLWPRSKDLHQSYLRHHGCSIWPPGHW